MDDEQLTTWQKIVGVFLFIAVLLVTALGIKYMPIVINACLSFDDIVLGAAGIFVFALGIVGLFWLIILFIRAFREHFKESHAKHKVD